MALTNDPRYDGDLVNKSYVDRVANNLSTEAAESYSKNFSTQPNPPYFVNDTWTDGTNLWVCKTERLIGNYNSADWQKATAYTDNTELNTFVSNVYTPKISEMTTAIDGKITTWFYTGIPTLATIPATAWTTNAIKDTHLGDLYFDQASGFVYRFTYTTVYEWIRIKDSDIVAALTVANTAQDTADSKRRVFTTTPTTPYEIGDLWAGGTTGDIKRCKTTRLTGSYNASDWENASKYTDDTIANTAITNAATAQSTANTAITNAATAQSAANAAQSTANTANTSATTANTLLSDLASDSKLTAVEKQQIKLEWDAIVSEKTINDTQATAFGITTEKTNYGTAYTTLSNYITPLLSSLTTTSDITGTTFRTNFKDYYDKRQLLLNAIASKSKTLADTAQSTANTAVTNAATAQAAIDNLRIGGRNVVQQSNKFGTSLGPATGIVASINAEGYLQVVSSAGNGNWLTGWIKTYDGIETSFNDNDPFTISFVIKSADTTSKPTVYLKSGMGYFTMTGTVGTEFSTIYYTGTWKKANGLAFHLGFSSVVGTTIIKQWKIEKGNRVTDWTAAPEDVELVVADMANDDKLTPDEKQQLKKELDMIVTEKVRVDAQATTYGITTEKTNYGTSYTTLYNYVNPLLSNLTTTSAVVGTTLRSYFADYIDKREILIQKITDTAKTLISTAQSQADLAITNAATAQTQANAGVTNAATANALLADIASDIKITPVEKLTIKQTWDAIVIEATPTTGTIPVQATQFGVVDTDFDTAYDSLKTYLLTTLNVFNSMSDTTTIVRDTWNTKWTDYYNQRTILLNAIATKAKTLADTAQTTINNQLGYTPSVFTQSGTALTFSDVVNGSFSGNTFTKTAGTTWDAGFRSVQTFTNGQYIEFNVSSTTSTFMFGFNNGTNDANFNTIDFAAYKIGTTLMFYTNGAQRGTIGTVALNDKIRLAIYDSTVTIYKNDVAIYRSIVVPTLPLYIDCSVSTINATVQNIVHGTIVQSSLKYQSENNLLTASQALDNAQTAQNSANTANTAISDIASDSRLTPSEKQDIKLEWDIILSEKTLNDTQATSFGVTTEKTTYGTAFQALATYLNNGTAWVSGTPSWLSNLTTTQTMVGDTFRSTFKTYYDARTNLLNKIAANAKSLAESYADAQLASFVTNTYTPDINGINTAIDGKITTWFYTGIPTLATIPATAWTTNAIKDTHLGDLYFDQASGFVYRFTYTTVYEWIRIKDSDITASMSQANLAKDTADGKRRVFVVEPTTPYDIGDIWVGDETSDLQRCSVARASGAFSATDWIIATKYTDDTVALDARAVADRTEELVLTEYITTSTLTTTEKNILASVGEDLITKADTGIVNTLGSAVTELETRANGVDISITNINNNGVTKVVTSTGFKFDSDGLSISKTDEPMSALVDNTGLYVNRNADNVLTVNDIGVEAENVKVRNFLQIGTTFRVQDYSTGIGFFFLGGD